MLANPRARTVMLAKHDLRLAHAQVERKGERFEKALVGAKQQVEIAAGQLIGFDPDDSTLLEIGKDLRDGSAELYDSMLGRTKRATSKAKK